MKNLLKLEEAAMLVVSLVMFETLRYRGGGLRHVFYYLMSVWWDI